MTGQPTTTPTQSTPIHQPLQLLLRTRQPRMLRVVEVDLVPWDLQRVQRGGPRAEAANDPVGEVIDGEALGEGEMADVVLGHDELPVDRFGDDFLDAADLLPRGVDDAAPDQQLEVELSHGVNGTFFTMCSRSHCSHA